MKLTDINTAVDVLIEAIKTDYREYTERNAVDRAKRNETDGELTDINNAMISEFEDEIGFIDGKKYIKITNRNHGSAWGFVVKEDGPKFRKGDILKAAGWSAPATNKPRGNVFDGYKINWTGPAYL